MSLMAMNDASYSRVKSARSQSNFIRYKMYFSKSNGTVKLTRSKPIFVSSVKMYVIFLSGSESKYKKSMIFPDDFGKGITRHYHSSCVPGIPCPCPQKEDVIS